MIKKSPLIWRAGFKRQFFFFHKNKSIEKCQKISKDIYFGGNFNQIIEYINCNLISVNEIFFCLGYCGWGKNQLEREIKENHGSS